MTQWAVCDQQGNVLGSGYVKPTILISEDALEVHGISEGQLTNAPSFAEVWPTLRNLLKDRLVAIYKEAVLSAKEAWRAYSSCRAAAEKEWLIDLAQA
jgi:DNA polymerase III epsilon subunit-like protein